MTEPNDKVIAHDLLKKAGLDDEEVDQLPGAIKKLVENQPDEINDGQPVFDQALESLIGGAGEDFASQELMERLARIMGNMTGTEVAPDDPRLAESLAFFGEMLGEARDDVATLANFSFDTETCRELADMIGGDDQSFIKALQDSASIYVRVIDDAQETPTPKEQRAAFKRLENKAKAMTDYLADIDREPLIYEPLLNVLELQGHGELLESMRMELNVLLTTIRAVKPQRGSQRKWAQQQLAIAIGKLLRERGVKLTKYRKGSFCTCLKLVLQAADTIGPDDPWQTESDPLNIIRAIWPLLEDK